MAKQDLRYLYLMIYFEICMHTFFHENNKDALYKRKEEYCIFTKSYMNKSDVFDDNNEFKWTEKKALTYISKNNYGFAFYILSVEAINDRIKKRIKKLLAFSKAS
jgi:hypothetical protein